MKHDIIHDKGTRSLPINEDAYILTENVVGVFDGASSLVPYLSLEGKTGGYLASHRVAQFFAGWEGPLREGLLQANQVLSQEMRAANISVEEVESLRSTTAALVQIGENIIHRATVSDSMILVIYQDCSHATLNKYHDHDAELLAQIRILKKEGKDVSFDQAPLLEKSIKLRNNANITFGSVNGQQALENHIQHGSCKREGVSHILLFTDGLFIPKEEPYAPENFSPMVDIYLEEGMQGVLDHVRALESSDPDCTTFTRYKKHDDATGIAIILD